MIYLNNYVVCVYVHGSDYVNEQQQKQYPNEDITTTKKKLQTRFCRYWFVISFFLMLYPHTSACVRLVCWVDMIACHKNPSWCQNKLLSVRHKKNEIKCYKK